MKLRLKVEDLVNMLVFDYREDVARKYNLSKSSVRRVEKALKRGAWRVA